MEYSITYKNLPIVKKKYKNLRKVNNAKIDEIKKITNDSSYPETITFFLKSIEKIELLKSSIDKCLKNSEFYSSSILLRCLLEHKLILFYIWIKFNEDKDDTCV